MSGDLAFQVRLGRLIGPDSLFWLRTGEAALGVCLVAGLWVRGLAALQTALLVSLGAAALRAEPGTGAGLGFLLRTSGCLAGGLVLARTGGGSHALDGWLAQRHTVRRHRLRWALERHRILLAGLAEVCRVQMQGAGDARTLSALDALRLDVAEDVNDVAVLIRRQGGRPLPLLGPVRGLFWVPGCLTVIGGMRVARRIDRWLVVRSMARYAWMVDLAAPEDGITARALAAMRDREARHTERLRDPVEEPRRPGARRR